MKLLKNLVVMLAVAAPLTLSSAAMAQDAGDSDCAKARKQGRVCELVIDGDDIEGGTPTGTGEQLRVRDFSDFTNLIEIRKDFRDFIIKSAENL